MTPTLYNFSLLLAAWVCGFAGMALIVWGLVRRYETTYQRATLLSGIVMWIFAVGFGFHLHFDLRGGDPAAATAL